MKIFPFIEWEYLSGVRASYLEADGRQLNTQSDVTCLLLSVYSCLKLKSVTPTPLSIC